MKIHRKPRAIATTKDIVRLARRTKWRDIEFANGEVVEAETIRQMFEYAAADLKPPKTRERSHVSSA